MVTIAAVPDTKYMQFMTTVWGLRFRYLYCKLKPIIFSKSAKKTTFQNIFETGPSEVYSVDPLRSLEVKAGVPKNIKCSYS